MWKAPRAPLESAEMGNVLGCQIWRRCEDDPTSSEILAACPWAGAASDFLARLCDTFLSEKHPRSNDVGLGGPFSGGCAVDSSCVCRQEAQ